MANRQLVLAVFPEELAADSAAGALKASGIADGDAIGILVLDADGKLKQDKVGAHSTGKGAAIGGVIAVFSTALLGPAVLAGAAAGAIHHKNLGLSDAEKARLTVELGAGKAAVAVMAPFDTAPAISDRLTELGGTPERYDLTDEALQAAAAMDRSAV
ncbi:MAG: putative rane protein [Solirubrobacterales bacterium]|nr:putative rane protein [Solirubrobacterales bacterium]